MAGCVDQSNRLQRDGTSQSQRALRALEPSSAPIDEREISDFLVFAQGFARRVVHRDLDNEDLGGDWEAFFASDTSAVIASIEKTSPAPLRAAAYALIRGPREAEALEQLFAQLTSLTVLLEHWRTSVGGATDFREQIDQRIRANLAGPLTSLIRYRRAASASFADEVSFDAGAYAFAASWGVPAAEDLTPDAGLFGPFEAAEDRIGAAFERLEALFVVVYNVLLEVIALAPSYFTADLEGRSDHEPHLALFVAFLRLYLLVRDDANQLTERHLEFFYRDVLGLETRPAEPDHVHLVAELARQAGAEHRIAAVSAVDAGKDASGVALRYRLDADLVANRALVESLRTVFVVDDENGVKTVRSAPIANSQDGLGAELEDAEMPSWATLGSATMPPATLGLALASRDFLLAEGARTITVDLHVRRVPDGLAAALTTSSLAARFSGEAGWVVPRVTGVSLVDVATEGTDDGEVTSGTLRVQLALDSTDEAVTFASADVLEVDYGTSEPLLELTLRHPVAGDPPRYPYGGLRRLQLTRVVVRTNVTGLTKLVVQNEQFTMDPTKAFQPFGFAPTVGSSLFVGSLEAFQKDLISVTLHADWDGLPSSFTDHYAAYPATDSAITRDSFRADVEVRVGGSWQSAGTEQVLLGSSGGSLASLEFPNLGAQTPVSLDALGAFTPATQAGFVRLVLKNDFLHGEYIAVATRQSLAAAALPDGYVGAYYRDALTKVVRKAVTHTTPVGDNEEVLVGNPPYTPTARSLTLDYVASTDSAEHPHAIEVVHVEPFGHRRVALAAQPTLLPQLPHAGALHVGLSGLQPLQSLSLLFQVAEATADTDVRTPTVTWAYLTEDDWVDFEDYEVTSDTTKGLIASGIVQFTIPRAVSAASTRMPAGLHWLRASVDEHPGGVSETIDVRAQAVRATWTDQSNDQSNDPGHLAAPLPAGSVKGLVVEDARVAGLSQPHDGFGGRAAETDASFHTRAAEYLRHKGRAITLFDYERLVLERFPGIYRTKCVNHTRYDPLSGAHELAPGHVLIAVIPDFTQLKAVDRTQPKVTLDELDEISSYLQTLNCAFVRTDRRDGRPRLHVLNPQYEELRVRCKVRFRPEVTAPGFFSIELNAAINRFLSPWAYQDGAEIAFGGKVYKSSLVNFVEEQSYVDYVIDFEMTHAAGEEDVDSIEALTPRSILVPVEQHDIVVLATPDCPLTHAKSNDGIGQMAVARDFAITPPQDTKAP